MRYNVAPLLKEPIGSIRTYELEESFSNSRRVIDSVSGQVRMMRTHQGILVTGAVEISVSINCSRCLRSVSLPYSSYLEEEFFPSIDIESGRRQNTPEGVDDPLYIDNNHVLDLGELLRQQALADLPVKPLCQSDCQGLCPQCGGNRNEGACACDAPPVDPRWNALESLLRETR